MSTHSFRKRSFNSSPSSIVRLIVRGHCLLSSRLQRFVLLLWTECDGALLSARVHRCKLGQVEQSGRENLILITALSRPSIASVKMCLPWLQEGQVAICCCQSTVKSSAANHYLFLTAIDGLSEWDRAIQPGVSRDQQLCI